MGAENLQEGVVNYHIQGLVTEVVIDCPLKIFFVSQTLLSHASHLIREALLIGWMEFAFF